MKKLLLFAFLLSGTLAYGQFGTAFHYSSLPFVEVNYEINDRIRPMARLGVNSAFEDLTFEIDGTYDLLQNDEYEFYAGIGFIVGWIDGLVIPVGLNIYPLTSKKFGFQMEVAPIIGDPDVLRGSLGIRYRFLE